MVALINGFNLALENGHALCTVVWLNNSALCGALGLGKQQQTVGAVFFHPRICLLVTLHQ